MATVQNVTVVSIPRGASLVGDFGEVVKINASGQAILTAAATDVAVGVVAEAPNAASTGVGRATPPTGSAVAVALFQGGGILKAKAGAAITAGQLVVLDSTAGRLAGVANVAAVTDDSLMLGVALQAAADGEIFEMLAQVSIA